MNHKLDYQLAMSACLLLTLVLVGIYTEYRHRQVRFKAENGTTMRFVNAGMMALPQPDGTVMYVPAYRRIQE